MLAIRHPLRGSLVCGESRGRFSETPEFLKFFQEEDVSATAPDYQKTLWQLYDCPPWARNLATCPTVAYSGEVDRQKQAADVMEAALEKVEIDLVHVRWSILSSFQFGGLNLTWFQSRDRIFLCVSLFRK